MDLVSRRRRGFYARASSGRKSSSYKAAATQKAGRIRIAGREREVAFEPAMGDVIHQVDEAYRVKYRKSPYLASMIGDHARAATVRISPR